MKKVEILVNTNYIELKEEINRFIYCKDNIIDIKYIVSSNVISREYSALIIYEEVLQWLWRYQEK